MNSEIHNSPKQTATKSRPKFSLWLQAMAALLVFFLFQNLTVLIKEAPIRKARAETAQQQAVVVLAGQAAPITLHDLNAACFDRLMQRARSEDLWLHVRGQDILLGNTRSYEVVSGSLKLPHDPQICNRLRGVVGDR